MACVSDGCAVLGEGFERVTGLGRLECEWVFGRRKVYDEPCCFDAVLVKQLQKALRSYCPSPETYATSVAVTIQLSTAGKLLTSTDITRRILTSVRT
jgi:hypothetical protein